MAKDDDAGLGDGTQPAAFGDALSGPVSDSGEEFQLTRVASPVKPDPEAVRDLVDAEMARERGGTAAFAPADAETQPPAGDAEPIPPAAPLGMLPRQRSRPGLGRRRPSLRMPRVSLPSPDSVRRVRPSSGSTGVIVAVILLIIFVVLAIEFVTSLVGSIMGAFS
ncbi:hypothetical protein [Amycolatopsis pigmentata]|uniref:Uncharacterized protein n=1 Tax=Amycolatopsis pigmentata TaxID=450801 RepID=A0ABW5FSH1_9PSEU